MDYLIVAVAAFVVAIGSSIAGGGGGLIMTPLMLLLGFTPQAALASAKAAGVGINVGALGKFTQEKNIIHWRWAGLLSMLAILASVIGTRIVFITDSATLETLIGVITVGLVPIIFLSKNIGTKTMQTSKLKKILGTLLYFVIMTTQAGLGSGIGMLLMFVLIGMMGLDALTANATKRVAGLALVIVSFVIFVFSGYMNWLLAACLGTGMLLGGYIGAHIAVKHGSPLVKQALLILTFIMGLSVLLR